MRLVLKLVALLTLVMQEFLPVDDNRGDNPMVWRTGTHRVAHSSLAFWPGGPGIKNFPASNCRSRGPRWNTYSIPHAAPHGYSCHHPWPFLQPRCGGALRSPAVAERWCGGGTMRRGRRERPRKPRAGGGRRGRERSGAPPPSCRCRRRRYAGSAAPDRGAGRFPALLTGCRAERSGAMGRERSKAAVG